MLNQILPRAISQVVARDGVELEMNTILDWEPMEAPSDCSRDRIVYIRI